MITALKQPTQHPDWPTETHPHTGEPFIEGSICADYPQDRFEYRRPDRPEPRVETKPMVCEWDGEEEWYEEAEYRDATAEEYADMLANYEKALAEWTRTMGVIFVHGPTHITGEFRCKSGSSVRGVRRDDGKWSWLDDSTHFKNR